MGLASILIEESFRRMIFCSFCCEVDSLLEFLLGKAVR